MPASPASKAPTLKLQLEPDQSMINRIDETENETQSPISCNPRISRISSLQKDQNSEDNKVFGIKLQRAANESEVSVSSPADSLNKKLGSSKLEQRKGDLLLKPIVMKNKQGSQLT